MDSVLAFLIALLGALLGIVVYRYSQPRPIQKEVVEVIQEPSILPYWTSYDPGYGYWPRWMDSYWLNYIPYYGPITGGSYYSPWGGGGRHHYIPRHGYGGYSGVAVGGGGGGHSGGGHGGGGHGGGGH